MRKRKRKPAPPFRSLYEEAVAASLGAKGMRFKYEEYELEFDLGVPNAWCEECDGHNIFQTKTYTPDFFLSNGVIIEAKGKLDLATRKRMVAVKAAHPTEDIRILFMKNNRISRGAKSRYLDWAAHRGFIAAVGPEVPDTWLLRGAKRQ